MGQIKLKRELNLTAITIGLLSLFLFSLIAKAEEVAGDLIEILPVDDVDLKPVIDVLPNLLDAIMNGHWMIAGGLFVFVGTFLVRRFVLPRLGLKTYILPLVAMGLSLLGTSAMVLVETDGDYTAALFAFIGALLAPSFYDLVKGMMDEKKNQELGKVVASRAPNDG
jgi:hypothetical protein